jgi:fructose-1,6-bisphosphatase I
MTNDSEMMTPEPISLNKHLFHTSKASDDLRHLILDIARAAKYIQFALRTTQAGLAGTKNQFGEDQIKIDVLSDDIIQQHLRESRLVASYISEEQSSIIELEKNAPFSVVFDPLDGSSLVDVNFSIGSIFGIYPGADLIGRKPREQIGALYVVYGPRTLLIYSTGNGVHEFLLDDVGEFVLLREFIGIADEAKNYSPGNLRAVKDNAGYMALMQIWMEEELTLRYSGAMVADVHHIFSKGQGIFANVGGKKYPEGKLRLVFECGPLAYLAEQAGGNASDGQNAILDKTIMTIDQRSPIILGSKNEVERSVRVLQSSAS